MSLLKELSLTMTIQDECGRGMDKCKMSRYEGDLLVMGQ
jgi:hypothetical protein